MGAETSTPHPVIAVVIPAYECADTIGKVIAAVPSLVSHIVVVDDASSSPLAAVLESLHEPRLVILRHAENRGVGGAMKTGFEKALSLGADIVVKIDADGQMDPALIDAFVEPLIKREAGLVKGNRFANLAHVRDMPLLRRIGNLGLSYFVKMASGYWSAFDPCNGFLALNAALLRTIRFGLLADRYFFEISLLCESYNAHAVVAQIPMRPRYEGEISHLSPLRSLVEFLPRLLGRTLRRVFETYFLYDFNVVSLFVATGAPSLGFGAAWSAYHWHRSIVTGRVATTGTVMIGTLAIILGFQLLLQAAVLDVQNEPGRPPRRG